MVSNRCKILVKEVLKNLNIHFTNVNLGEVEVMEELNDEQLALINATLKKSGLELMSDKKSILIERIKNVITEMVHYDDELPNINFSAYLSEKLHYDYTYLSNLFSEKEAVTIEHYILLHKIEMVKELIIYDELNLTEIAYKLHYSSVSHLSKQFKKITGLTPSFFKNLKTKKRNVLEYL